MELRDYQIEIADRGSDILSEYRILYLSMQTRTGKTLTALQICKNLLFKHVLFVTKKKAIPSIEKDFEDIGKPFNILITNYESLHKVEQAFDCVIIDEAHSIGAFPKPSLRTKQLKMICRGLPIIYLSGTPTPEGYSQIFHQFWISSFSPFFNYVNFYKWAHQFVDVKKKYLYNREINDYSCANEEQVKSKIKHLFITYSQEEAGFEKTIEEEVLYCVMDSKISVLREVLKRDLVYESKDGWQLVADTAVRLQQLDHQISSGTVIDYEDNKHILDTSKADFIKNYFNGKKIVIFYKFRAEFDLLKQVFDNWTDIPEVFQVKHDSTFLGQFQSAREGIRLDTADALIFYNIDFSALSYFQSKDRIVSFERKKDAKLYWIFSVGGIEKNIYKAVTSKKDYTLNYYLRDEKIKRNRFREQEPGEDNKENEEGWVLRNKAAADE